MRRAISVNHLDAGDEHVIAAIFGGVVFASVSEDAPIPLEGARDARSARSESVAVEKGEIRRHEVLSVSVSQGQHRREIICEIKHKLQVNTSSKCISRRLKTKVK